MLKLVKCVGVLDRSQLIVDSATVHVDVVTQNGAVTATTNRGAIKTWATIDASAKWLKGPGIGRAQLEIGKWLPGQRGMSL